MSNVDGTESAETAALTFTIRPSSGWASLRMGEVWQYRELLYFFVWRDLKVRYRQTAIGAAWAVLQPLALVVIFTLILGRVPGLAPEGISYALFALAGLVPWTLFSQGLGRAAGSVVEASNMVRKVYFPRLLLPISASLGYLLDFLIASLLLVVLVLIGGYGISLAWVLLAPLALLILITVLGAGFWLSAVNVRYRDVKNLVPFVIQLLFFATPIVYSAAIVPDELWLVYHLNPMAGVVEGFRWVFFGANLPAPTMEILIGSMAAIALLLSGQAYFRRTERTFADVI